MNPEDARPKEPAVSAANPELSKTDFVKHPNGIVEIYTNLIHITWTLFDVRLRLSQILPTATKIGEDTRGFVAQENAGLTMAWPEAKALRNMLADAVERYEKANGEIKELKLAQ